jgi:predicted nucleic acid-binding protein
VRTAIDANVFSAIWSAEVSARNLIAQLGDAKGDGALLISPFVFAELLAYPGISESYVRAFLEDTGVQIDLKLEERIWAEAGNRFAQYASRRRKATNRGPRRLLADFLIGAHALVQTERLLTLDWKVYQLDFPELQLL